MSDGPLTAGVVESVRLAGAFALHGLAGYAYLSLVGLALARWLTPRAWRPLWPLFAPYLGWSVVVATAYPLNTAVPGRAVLLGLLGGAVAVLAARAAADRARRPAAATERATVVPLAAGVVTYAAGAWLYARAGTMSAFVADSDVEHFADVIAALLAYPIGWSLEAQMGLEATPIGLAYHYVHAAICAVDGADTFATAAATHLLMLALAPGGIYVFAREALGLGPRAAALASALGASGGMALGVAGFGWGQQTAALATVPLGLAAIHRALEDGGRRAQVAGGLTAGLAAGSLYLATAPVVGGVAIASAAALALRDRSTAPLRRALVVGTVALAAGALSHFSAAGYFVTRGGLQAGDAANRSTHVTTFASLPVALGVAPLDLFQNARGSDGTVIVAWQPVGGPPVLTLVTACALGVVAGGAVAVRRRTYAACIAVVVLGFELFVRVVRPFPYGEFKLLTSMWFVAPCLAAGGAGTLVRGRPLVGRLAATTIVVYAGGLLAAHAHTRTLLAGPWGAALPEREVDALRRAVGATPRGSSVWVSNQLAPAAAVDWRGRPTTHRAGFATREAAATFLAARWRGAATALLAFSGRPAYGAVQRHSTELRAPIDPSRADFLLLDASEDPLLYGLVESDLAYEAARLRLFRSPAPDGGATPHAVPPAPLPIGESLPGRRQGFTVRRTAPDTVTNPPPAGGAAYAIVGIFSTRESEVDVRAGARTRRLAVFPGLTWYATPADAPPSVLAGAAGVDDGGVRGIAARSVRADRWVHGEALIRSPAGINAPWLRLAETAGGVEFAYVNLTANTNSIAARMKSADALWLHGQTAASAILLDPPAGVGWVPLAPERRGALWVEIGPDGRPALHAPPAAASSAFYSLPLLGRAVPPARLEDGTLVKGTSARLYAVEGGTLRWVPTLDALERRGPLPRIVTLPDEALWRLPVALPLD